MESRASLNKKMVKVQRVICEYCDKLCDLNSSNTLGSDGGLEAMGELKEYLKVFIKEKENQYRIKIHNKLYGTGGGGETRRSGQRRVSSGEKKRKREQVEGVSRDSSRQQNEKKRRRVVQDYESDEEDSEYSI